MMNRLLILLSLLLISLATTAQAKIVEAEGIALVKSGAVGQAREMAIQQAIRQAQTQTLAMVDTASVIRDNTVVIDSTRVSAAGLVKDVVVLKEWRAQDLYHVRIRAQVVEERLRKPTNAARYRKKIAVSQFDIVDRRHIADMPYVTTDLPRELLRRIENSNMFLAFDGSDYQFSPKLTYNLEGIETSYQKVATHMAQKLDAQFIITGTIRDLGIDYGLLSNHRQIEMDVAVIDGLTGAVVSKHRVNETVRAGELPRNMVFGSANFLRSDLGRAFDVILDRLATRIIEDLSVLPFTAQVVRIEGNSVIFDAGTTSLVAVGDTLMGYTVENKGIYTQLGDKYLGMKELPVATMVVKQVQPQFAVAELETDDITLNPGDIVRFGW